MSHNGALRTQKDAFWRAWPDKRLRPSPIPKYPRPRAEYLIFEYLINSSESYGAVMGLFEPAVAHGLAPSAAAASSDALIPKPLAASSGTASACSYESTHACEVRLNRSGVHSGAQG